MPGRSDVAAETELRGQGGRCRGQGQWWLAVHGADGRKKHGVQLGTEATQQRGAAHADTAPTAARRPWDGTGPWQWREAEAAANAVRHRSVELSCIAPAANVIFFATRLPIVFLILSLFFLIFLFLFLIPVDPDTSPEPAAFGIIYSLQKEAATAC
jgi:hypothetical protein